MQTPLKWKLEAYRKKFESLSEACYCQLTSEKQSRRYRAGQHIRDISSRGSYVPTSMTREHDTGGRVRVETLTAWALGA
jgi:hypothetical protein